MARPLLDIDAVEVEKLAAMYCTMKEIAAFFDCSVDTLENRFSDVIAKGREKGKSKLRRLQWQSAEKGNIVMQIWLGKQILGQSDKQEVLTANIPVVDEEMAKQKLAELKTMLADGL